MDWLAISLAGYGVIAWFFAGMMLATGTTTAYGARIPTQQLAAVVLALIWPIWLLAAVGEALYGDEG